MSSNYVVFHIFYYRILSYFYSRICIVVFVFIIFNLIFIFVLFYFICIRILLCFLLGLEPKPNFRPKAHHHHQIPKSQAQVGPGLAAKARSPQAQVACKAHPTCQAHLTKACTLALCSRPRNPHPRHYKACSVLFLACLCAW